MGDINKYLQEKLIIGVLISSKIEKDIINKYLESIFGEIDYESSLIDFEYTDYYNNEMGQSIKRYFLSFEKLVDPSDLSDIKIKTNEIEEKYSEEGRRKVNLDPGIMSSSKFILATTKDNAHRIPLQKGIFGEITLSYYKKNFKPFEWTYIDYQSKEYSDILKDIRIIYTKQLKELKQ